MRKRTSKTHSPKSNRQAAISFTLSPFQKNFYIDSDMTKVLVKNPVPLYFPFLVSIEIHKHSQKLDRDMNAFIIAWALA